MMVIIKDHAFLPLVAGESGVGAEQWLKKSLPLTPALPCKKGRREREKPEKLLSCLGNEYREPGSNRHAHHWAKDFKSFLSTNSNIAAMDFHKSGTKVLLFFELCKFFCKNHYNCPASTRLITRSVMRSLSLASYSSFRSFLNSLATNCQKLAAALPLYCLIRS